MADRSLPTTSGSLWIDDRCLACGRSVAPRFPEDASPAYCQACEDEFVRELHAGHVRDYLSGVVILPARSLNEPVENPYA